MWHWLVGFISGIWGEKPYDAEEALTATITATAKGRDTLYAPQQCELLYMDEIPNIEETRYINADESLNFGKNAELKRSNESNNVGGSSTSSSCDTMLVAYIGKQSKYDIEAQIEQGGSNDGVGEIKTEVSRDVGIREASIQHISLETDGSGNLILEETGAKRIRILEETASDVNTQSAANIILVDTAPGDVEVEETSDNTSQLTHRENESSRIKLINGDEENYKHGKTAERSNESYNVGGYRMSSFCDKELATYIDDIVSQIELSDNKDGVGEIKAEVFSDEGIPETIVQHIPLETDGSRNSLIEETGAKRIRNFEETVFEMNTQSAANIILAETGSGGVGGEETSDKTSQLTHRENEPSRIQHLSIGEENYQQITNVTESSRNKLIKFSKNTDQQVLYENNVAETDIKCSVFHTIKESEAEIHETIRTNQFHADICFESECVESTETYENVDKSTKAAAIHEDKSTDLLNSGLFVEDDCCSVYCHDEIWNASEEETEKRKHPAIGVDKILTSSDHHLESSPVNEAMHVGGLDRELTVIGSDEISSDCDETETDRFPYNGHIGDLQDENATKSSAFTLDRGSDSIQGDSHLYDSPERDGESDGVEWGTDSNIIGGSDTCRHDTVDVGTGNDIIDGSDTCKNDAGDEVRGRYFEDTISNDDEKYSTFYGDLYTLASWALKTPREGPGLSARFL